MNRVSRAHAKAGKVSSGSNRETGITSRTQCTIILLGTRVLVVGALCSRRYTAKAMSQKVQATLIRKVELVPESEDRFPVYTITFANPDNAPPALGIRIDHGDIIKVTVPGREGGPKSYSMSGARDGEFDITYKLYPGGLCSGYLHSLQIGDAMECFGKSYKDRDAGAHVGIVAYGVGITECLPMAEAELRKPDAKAVSLLWASKRYGDKFWLDKVKELEDAYPGRFFFHTILSREEREGSLQGRVDASILKRVFIDPFQDADRDTMRFLAIGTKPMMKDCYENHLGSLGFDASKDGGKHALLKR